MAPLYFCAKRIAFDFASSSSLPFFNSGPEFVVDAFPKRGCVPRIIILMVFPLACCSCIILSMPSVTSSLIKMYSLFFKGGMRAFDEEGEGQVARAVEWVRDLPLLRVGLPESLLL